MSQNANHILTSHAGSLPRPDDLIELNRKRIDEEAYDEAEFQKELRDATIEVVRRQVETGIDVPNDGEFGHAMGQKVDYGAWWHYSFTRLSGIGIVDRHVTRAHRAGEDHDRPRAVLRAP